MRGEKSKPLSVVQVSIQWKSCCLLLLAVFIKAEHAEFRSLFTFEASFSHTRGLWENVAGITEIKNMGLQIRRVEWLQESNNGH